MDADKRELRWITQDQFGPVLIAAIDGTRVARVDGNVVNWWDRPMGPRRFEQFESREACMRAIEARAAAEPDLLEKVRAAWRS